MTFLADDDVERVLVVVAHPDDIDFGVAGSVAVWTDRGIEVQYCLVTDGDAGGSDRSVSRVEMAEIRRAEQTAAAKLVGVGDLHFLGFPDGRVQPDFDLRRAITRVIREVRPQRVVAMSPTRSLRRIYASHPDHLATGEATLCAVYPDARNPFAFPDLLDNGFEPWTVDEVLLTAYDDEPDRFVDVTDVFDRKLAALMCHESQHTDRARMETLLRGWGTEIARSAKLPEGRLAEGFLAVDTNPF